MKGLEAFDALGSAFLMKCKDYRNNLCKVLNIKTGKMYAPQELSEIVRKELKALELIIEYRVQISWFKTLIKNFPNYTEQDYNFALPDNMQLTREDYELLKEVLA